MEMEDLTVFTQNFLYVDSEHIIHFQIFFFS